MAGALPGWLPAAVRDRPLAEVALAWCLADPSLDRVVIGPRSTTQLATVPRAADLATHAELNALVERVRNHG